MRRCNSCWTYTFREVCPKCGSPTIDPHPKPFNPAVLTHDVE
ncbi:MAG: ribosome biogenesis protein [Thermoproteota archaeon]|nr:MAG: ribosome biogenesis protein [Candidatus Korarchaeota archaeon]